MDERIKHITIFGGGTSGWLTAAYLSKMLTFPARITLIESRKLGPIGVGEGTQPGTARFLHDAGLMPRDWMKPSSATFKYGVLLSGWNDEPFFIDNDVVSNTVMGPKLYTHDHFIDQPARAFRDWMPAYRLSMANKSPKLGGFDHVLSAQDHRDFGAVHFSALDVVEVLRALVKGRIRWHDTEIVEVVRGPAGIDHLVDVRGREHRADLFIDCSGFEGRLIEKALGVRYQDLASILPCDRAVTMPTEYTDPTSECHPYTRSTTMKAGWRWTIPTFQRIGNGYVYSSSHCSPDEAERELRAALGEPETGAVHLKMRCGTHEKVAKQNVVAVGLAGGFVEPLEATGITMTTLIVENLVELLNGSGGVWSREERRLLNKVYMNMFMETTAFIWAHYHFSSRKDTPFWRDIRRQKLKDAPDYVQEVLGLVHPRLHRRFFIDHKMSSFHTGHWFSLIHSNGAFQKRNFPALSAAERAYAEHYVRVRDFEIELVLKTFPNHYAFLKDWYGGGHEPARSRGRG